MLISRTPFRVSFFGGGTDYPTWYRAHGGCVLTSTINHYCYINIRYLPPFFNHRFRMIWSKVEEVSEVDQIEHPIVKAVLSSLKLTQGIEIHHQGDLPARAGLGSSSAFTVGLLHALYTLLDFKISKQQLAAEAVYVERNLMQEHVGVQDQIQTAFGGLNQIHIQSDGGFSVKRLPLSSDRSKQLSERLMLFFTGISRHASLVAQEKEVAITHKQAVVNEMASMVSVGAELLCGNQELSDFGRMLHEAWQLKKSICSVISSDIIDEIYHRARKAGAVGGKLLGAGGGGFILFYVEPELKDQVLKALSDLLFVPFDFEDEGSKILYVDQVQYSHRALEERNFTHLGSARCSHENMGSDLRGSLPRLLDDLPLPECTEMA